MNTTNSTLNTTALNKDYYDRQLLEGAKTRFVFTKYGQKRTVPLNNGKHVEFRRWNLFDVDDNMCALEQNARRPVTFPKQRGGHPCAVRRICRGKRYAGGYRVR